MNGAIAVDLGASSARFAAGWLEGDAVRFEIVEQISHAPVRIGDRLHWDWDRLVGFIRRAARYGRDRFGRCTLGVDTWGVDFGFLDDEGDLLMPPVCYRDASHERAFAQLASHRAELYRWTGCQHQPFNTIYQLHARYQEKPDLRHARRWLLLPDLFGWALTRQAGYDRTMASTTQLLGLDGEWSPEAFGLIEAPIPDLEPENPGYLGGYVDQGVRLVTVGGHDTASAVHGLGPYAPGEAFLNLGTWGLLGVVREEPLATSAAEEANLTNERTVEGKVRLLKNVPGFWIVNRLCEEGQGGDAARWLAGAHEGTDLRLPLEHPSLFAPESMREVALRLLSRAPRDEAEWAGIALHSLTDALALAAGEISAVTGEPVTALRAGGGGSQSARVRELLSLKAGMPVERAEAECTVLGNLRLQLERK